MKPKDKAHLLIAAGLFLAWFLLVYLKVDNSADLISYIKTGLALVGASHAVNKGRGMTQQAVTAPATQTLAQAAPVASPPAP